MMTNIRNEISTTPFIKSNSSSILKLCFVMVLGLLSACQNLPTVQTHRDSNPTSTSTTRASSDSTAPTGNVPSGDVNTTMPAVPAPTGPTENPTTGGSILDALWPSSTPPPPLAPPPLAKPSSSNLKVGVIIGPGFLRSFIALGILQELHRARLPIQALVGFEWGSLPAALYSLNGQVTEAEWQMLKLSETQLLKKSLLRNEVETKDITDLQEFFSQAFGGKTFEQARVPFECLTFDISRKQYFWMKKGELKKALPYCMATPPFSYPLQNYVGASDLKLAADNLRQKGANFILFINTISSTKDYLGNKSSSEAQLLWALQQYQLNNKGSGLIDFTIETSSAPQSLSDFGARRDMIRKGQEIGTQVVKKLSAKLKI